MAPTGAPTQAPRVGGVPGAAPGAPPAGGAGAAAQPSGTLGSPTDRALPDRPPPQIAAVMPEPGGLTASEVSKRALAVNAPVKQKRAELKVAQEKITQTMYQFFPKLTATASYTYLSPVTINFGPGASFTTLKDNLSLSGRISVPLSDYVLRLSDAAASSKAGSESAKYALRAQEMALDKDARTLYFNWLRAKGAVEIAQKAVERTRARLEDARASFTVGTISKGELLRIEAQVANTETTLTSAKAAEELTHGQLAIIMQEWNASYRVGEGIPEPSSIAASQEKVEDLVREAHSRRMEVKAVDESIKLYRHGASATRASALPRIDATGDITYADPNTRYFQRQHEWNLTYSAGIAATWTVFDTFLQSAAARELEANAQAAEARRIELKAVVANEVLTSYLDLAKARDQYAQQQVALAAAEEAYRVTTELFRAGRATGTDLIESENALLQAKLGEIDARINLTVAAITLRHATGRDIPSEAQVRNN